MGKSMGNMGKTEENVGKHRQKHKQKQGKAWEKHVQSKGVQQRNEQKSKEEHWEIMGEARGARAKTEENTQQHGTPQCKVLRWHPSTSSTATISFCLAAQSRNASPEDACNLSGSPGSGCTFACTDIESATSCGSLIKLTRSQPSKLGFHLSQQGAMNTHAAVLKE